MSKININGLVREMTEAEVKAWEQEMANMPMPGPDPIEARMTEIEAALIELAAMLGGA